MSRAELSYQQPSRGSRALVVVLVLAVIALGGWVLKPIVAAQFPTQVAALSAWSDNVVRAATQPPSPSPAAISQPPQRKATEQAMNPVPTPAAEPQPADIADAAPADDAQPMTLASIPDRADRPALAPPPALPPGLLPWPVVTAASEPPETIAASEPTVASEPRMASEPMAMTTPTADEAGPVPLPRKRPAARTMAQLAIPLPRPRPEAAPEVEETAELSPEEELFFRRQGNSD